MADEGKPDRAKTFADKAKDLEALRASVVDAASVGAGLWISYLFVLFYLLIAAGSVTHRDLLFENPIKLPFLNVELPLVGFFVLAPLLFLIVHTYVLLHFVLLADKVGVFHAELATQIADEDVRARLRRQLPSNIFVQFLAGPREVRAGVMGLLLRMIAQISLAIAPLALLVFMLLQFLPYHHEAIAWWQRLAVVADLALLWTLWPAIASGETYSIAWRDFRRAPVALSAVASVGLLLLVFSVATFPNEWLDKNPVSVRFIPRQLPEDISVRLVSLHDFLLAGNVDLIAGRPTSLWSNRLVLPGLDASGLPTLSLRGRRLEGAVLVDAKMRGADFTAANLAGAALDGADLREAKFECASPSTRWLAFAEDAALEKTCARLDGASLSAAMLQNAAFKGAQMRSTILIGARLQGARLNSANLRAADLKFAKLHCADLTMAQLQGADLLQGELQGARLDYAQLQGAVLESANLQGTSLAEARLDGADLSAAVLHGANLTGASFRGAFMKGVYVWRSFPPPGGRVIAPQTRAGSGKAFNDLKELITTHVADGEMRDKVLRQIAILDPALTVADEEEMAKDWADAAHSSFDPAAYERDLREIGCSEEGAPMVIRAFLDRLLSRFEPDSPQPAPLAAAFLDEAQCPGARGLSQDDKNMLRALRTPAPPKATDAAAQVPKH